jgi:hypothetical protein
MMECYSFPELDVLVAVPPFQKLSDSKGTIGKEHAAVDGRQLQPCLPFFLSCISI